MCWKSTHFLCNDDFNKCCVKSQDFPEGKITQTFYTKLCHEHWPISWVACPTSQECNFGLRRGAQNKGSVGVLRQNPISCILYIHLGTMVIQNTGNN